MPLVLLRVSLLRPPTLTWTQADPLYQFAQDLAWDEPRRGNIYAFSLNNPLRYFDPDGRESWWDRFTDWALRVDNRYRIANRAEGVGKVIVGGAGFVAGTALCETGAGCVFGWFLRGASSDVGGSGLSQVLSGSDNPTTVAGKLAGSRAQNLEEAIVSGGGLAWPFAQAFGVLKARAGIQSRAPIARGGAEVAKSELATLRGGADDASGVATLPTSDLEPTHALMWSRRQRTKLIADIKANGIQNPIKYVEHNGTKYVVDGHHRLAAAKALRFLRVPVQRVELPYGGYRTPSDLQYEPRP